MATATYDYQVRDRAGKVVKGKIDAESPAAVANKLKEMNQRPRPPRRPKPGSIRGPKAISNTISIPKTWMPPVQDHVNYGVPKYQITNGATRQAALSRAVDMINKAQPKFFRHPGSIPIYIP